MKTRIVCCIDDEESVPGYIKPVVLRAYPEVNFYFLKVGYPKDPEKTVNEAIDILAELNNERHEFGVKDENGETIGLSIGGVVKTIAAINKSKADVLFACDLSLDHTRWPLEDDDSLRFQQELEDSKDPQW